MIISGKFGLPATKKVEKDKAILEADKERKSANIFSFFPCKAGKINEICHIWMQIWHEYCMAMHIKIHFSNALY